MSLDEGLLIKSQHAQDLGYDAVVLFLDELILWLATRAGGVDFVSSEGSKLSKLVEAQAAGRPIPLVSFVARQRDLRDLVGDNLAGAFSCSSPISSSIGRRARQRVPQKRARTLLRGARVRHLPNGDGQADRTPESSARVNK